MVVAELGQNKLLANRHRLPARGTDIRGSRKRGDSEGEDSKSGLGGHILPPREKHDVGDGRLVSGPNAA